MPILKDKDAMQGFLQMFASVVAICSGYIAWEEVVYTSWHIKVGMAVWTSRHSSYTEVPEHNLSIFKNIFYCGVSTFLKQNPHSLSN